MRTRPQIISTCCFTLTMKKNKDFCVSVCDAGVTPVLCYNATKPWFWSNVGLSYKWREYFPPLGVSVTYSHTCAGGETINSPAEHLCIKPGRDCSSLLDYSTHFLHLVFGFSFFSFFHHGGPEVSHQRPFNRSNAQGEEQSKRRWSLYSLLSFNVALIPRQQ